MRNDPYAKFNFLVEIDGQVVGGFTEVSGLKSENEVFDYRQGDDPPWPRKLLGLGKNSNIMLKQGTTDNKVLWEWRRAVVDGIAERRDGAIILLNEAREPVQRTEWFAGLIMSLELSALNATANESAIDSAEIAVEQLRLAL